MKNAKTERVYIERKKRRGANEKDKEREKVEDERILK